MARGNIDFDQLQDAVRKGNGAQFQMFGGGSTLPNAPLLYDAYGNAVAGTVQGNTSKVQMASGGAAGGHVPIYDAGGNLIDAGAAPVLHGSGTTTVGHVGVFDSDSNLVDGGPLAAGGGGGTKWWTGAGNPSGESVDIAPHTMTSNTSPIPYVVSASDNYGNLGDSAEWKAFNGVLSGWGWLSNFTFNPSWLQVDLGSQGGALARYAISGSQAGQEGLSPKNWTFLGSNNGSVWDTLDTRLEVANWTAYEVRSFTLSPAPTIGYRFYRISVTASASSMNLSISQMYLFSTAGAFGSGADGDFYIDTLAKRIYGPRTNSLWPLIGTLS